MIARVKSKERYQNVQGFSASAAIQEIREHEYLLTPGRYVGTGIRTDTTTDSVIDLQHELERLHLRAVEVDAIADQQLRRIKCMESLIGTVPDGWGEVTLGDVCDILTGPSGARLALEPRSLSNIPVITPRDLRNNKIAEDGSTAVRPGLAEVLSRYRLSSGDVVCSRTGELGRQALASKRQEGWLVGTGCLRLRIRRQISAPFLIYYLGHPTVQDWIIRNATGSAIPTLNTKTLGSLPVVLPPVAVQSVAAEVLGALDEKIAVHDQISRTTAELRDALLPLLLTNSVETTSS